MKLAKTVATESGNVTDFRCLICGAPVVSTWQEGCGCPVFSCECEHPEDAEWQRLETAEA